MELYSKSKNYKLYQGNMLDMLDTIEENSIDAIVTDPPYELNFMGKGWDNAGVSFNKETWKKCLDVLKPGGYLLAFGGSRTFHRIACAIEDAGFEIRDTIMWLYGSGFPKSMNIGLAIDKKNGVESPVVGQNEDILKKQAKDIREGHRKIMDSYNQGAEDRNNGFKTVSADIKEAQNEWQGWGTCLKPAFEPIIMARKPFKGSLVDNVIENGVGGLNIDECRVGNEERTIPIHSNDKKDDNTLFGLHPTIQHERIPTTQGRFPANLILTYDEGDKDEVCSGFPNSKGAKSQNNFSNGKIYREQSLNESSSKLNGYREWYNDEGSAARYFYCAKASKKDRDEGLDNFVTKTKVFNGKSNKSSTDIKDVEQRFTTQAKNIHPTVKPTELMQYLVRLVAPKGATILDPFNGSGSTGKAVMYENKEREANYKYIGIELTEEYLPISKARLDFVCGSIEQTDITDTTNTPEEEIWNQIKNVLDIKE